MLKDVAKGMSRSIANMGYTKSIQNLKKSQEQLSPAEKEAVYKKSTIVLKASASNLDKIMETYKNNSSQQDIQPQSKANSLYSSMSRISKSSEMKVANIDDSVESVNKEIAPIEHQVINVSENSKDRNSELKIPEIENSLLTNVQNNRIGKPVSPFMQRNTTLITNNRKTLSPFATPEPETNSNRESVIVIDQPSNSESDTYATRKTSKRPISRLNIPSNNLETNDTDPKPLSAMNMLTVVAPLPLSTSHSAEDVWGQAKRVSEPRSSFQRQIKQADSVAESLLSQLEQVVEKVRKGEVIDEANEDAGNVNDAPDEALLEAKDEVTQLKEEKQEELNVPDLQFQKHSILISKATTRNSHLNDKLKIADAAAEALLADFQLPSSQPGSNQNSPRFQNKTIRQSHATGSRINSVRHSTFSTTNDTSLQQEPQGSPKTGQFPSSRINTVRQSGIATAIAPVDTEKQELKGSPETRNISIRQSKMVVPIGTSNLKQKEEVQESPKLTHFGTRINSVREIKSDSTEANDLSSEHPPLKDSQLEHQMPSASDQTVDNTSARIASIKIKPNPFKRNTMSTESPSHSPYSSNGKII
ncbi:hypothetical protein BC833DRAFT_443783 [Globomyces pollinis-pini]|nr:hypothetical protein BC833DRAFT_443783 [Globomyces pollinis-pini]